MGGEGEAHPLHGTILEVKVTIHTILYWLIPCDVIASGCKTGQDMSRLFHVAMCWSKNLGFY